MLKTTGKIIRFFWILFCIVVGALIGAALLSGGFSSMPRAVTGGLLGAVFGGLFGRYVNLLDALEVWFD